MGYNLVTIASYFIDDYCLYDNCIGASLDMRKCLEPVADGVYIVVQKPHMFLSVGLYF